MEDWNKPADCPGSFDPKKVSCKDCEVERKTGCIHTTMMERQLAQYDRSSGLRAEHQSPPVTWREIFGKGPMDRFARIYRQFRDAIHNKIPPQDLEEEHIISLFQLYVDRSAIGLIDRIWEMSDTPTGDSIIVPVVDVDDEIIDITEMGPEQEPGEEEPWEDLDP